MQEDQLWSFAADLAPLAGSLDGRDTCTALAAAFAALAKLLPGLQHPSALLTDLNAMSTTEVHVPAIHSLKSTRQLSFQSLTMRLITGQFSPSACNITAMKLYCSALTLWLCLLSG